MNLSKTSTRTPFFKLFGIALLIASTVVGGVIWFATYRPPVGGDFSVTLRGQEWHLSENAKDLNILYIGYAKCPDVCPLSLSVAGQAFQKIRADQAARVQLLFLSVDRDHDDPNDVARYASQFFPSFLGFSGSREQIDRVVSMYHASYVVEKNPQSYLGYSISHSDRMFFLNKKGVVVAMINNPRSADDILKAIQENL